MAAPLPCEGSGPPTAAQFVRSLRVSCTVLSPLGGVWKEAADLGEDATWDDVLDLVLGLSDHVAEIAGEVAPDRAPPHAEEATAPDRSARSALSDDQRAAVEVLVKGGMADHLIAKQLGVRVHLVGPVRRRAGFDRSAGSPDPPTDAQRAEIVTLARARVTDPEIAQKLGLTRDVVRRVRQKADVRRTREEPLSARSGWEDRLRDLHGRGMTDPEIVAATGWSPRTTQEYRHRLGLKVNRPAKQEGAAAFELGQRYDPPLIAS